MPRFENERALRPSCARHIPSAGIGRVRLLGASICGGVDVFNSVRGRLLPLVTLRSVLDLSPLVAGPSVSPTIKVAIGLVVDSPLWVLLIVLAAIPYALAIERYLKAES